MIEIEINGSLFTDFESITATRSLESMADDFKFKASATSGAPAIRLGDVIRIVVDDEPVMTGKVEEISGSVSDGSHTIDYSGRDITSDLIDSTLDRFDDLRASEALTLAVIIQRVLDHIGSSLAIVDEVEPAPFNEAEDIVTTKIGQKAIELISFYARKRQVVLTSNADGAIVISRSDAAESTAAFVQSGNNILSETYSISISKRYNRYVRRSQLDPRTASLNKLFSAGVWDDQGGVFIDNDVPPGRQLVVKEGSAYSNGGLQDRAEWSAKLARAKSLRYSCVAADHSVEGVGVWRPNTKNLVLSDPADISSEMLITEVEFSQAEGQSNTTKLTFVEPDVFTLEQLIKPTGATMDLFKTLGG